MIELEIHYLNSAKRLMLSTLLTLPNGLRPTSFSEGEGEKEFAIGDAALWLEIMSRNQLGFMLRSPDVTYDLEFNKNKPIIFRAFCNTSSVLAKDILVKMATARPYFGFSCDPKEREHLNRITTVQGNNTIESWVGRDPRRYVPGLYWITLFSNIMATQHRVPLEKLKADAFEYLRSDGESHIFQFYEQPEEWSAPNGVGALISSLPAVFDIEKVRTQVAATKTFLELNEVTRAWP